MTKKIKIEGQVTINLSEQCSAIIQRKLSEKLKDPGSFTIPCSIEGHTIEKVVYDLRPNINLMPSSILNNLNTGDLTLTSIFLQMADRSIAFPRGILEDVLVKVDKFIFPVQFKHRLPLSPINSLTRRGQPWDKWLYCRVSQNRYSSQRSNLGQKMLSLWGKGIISFDRTIICLLTIIPD